MADDLNRLLIKIQADTSQLATALRAAESGVAQSSQRIERTIEKNASKFKKWGNELAGQLKGAAAGFIGLQLAAKAVEAVHLVADIDDMSQAAGIGSERFQELSFAAHAAGASTEDLAKGLNKFNLAVSGVRTNTGGFNEFLKEQAPALHAALAATTNQEEAVRVLSDAMAGLGDDSQRATLLQQAFGKSSKELIGVLASGSRALDDAGKKAHDLGGVLDQDLIKRAAEAEAEFAALETVLTSTFQRAAVEAAKFGLDVAHALAHPIELLEKMNSVSGAAMSGVGARGRSPMAIAKDPWNEGGRSLELRPDKKAPPTSGWDAWTMRAKPDNTGRDALANLQKQFDQSNGHIQQVLQDQYDQELKQWQEMLDKKQITESQFAEARAQLGIIMLNAQKENLGAETQQQKEYYSQVQGLMQSTFMDSFSTALETGKFKASEFFNSMLQGFAKITTEVLVLKPLLNSLFSSSTGSTGIVGGLLNSLGGMFSPARAAGGPGNSGQSYLVGEHGPEIFTPSANGSFGGSGVYARGSGSGGNYTFAPTIDARGADIGVVERIQQALAASQRAQQSPVTSVRNAQKRFPNR